jgi:hypothetical protein
MTGGNGFDRRRFCRRMQSISNSIAMVAVLVTYPVLAIASEAEPPTISGPSQFASRCALCHGDDALGTDRAPALLNNRQLRGRS